jgi:hypothetical protein
MSSSIDTKFLADLLAFPADSLDKKTIQYIYNMCTNTTTSSSTQDKPKKERKSKSKDDKKENDENKPKRKLNDKLAARNAYWAEKKAENMSYKDFNALWKSMTDDEKDVINKKYATKSSSSSLENSSADNTDDEIDIAINKLQEEFKESSMETSKKSTKKSSK